MGCQMRRQGWIQRQELLRWTAVICCCLQLAVSLVANAEECGAQIAGYEEQAGTDYPGNDAGHIVSKSVAACTAECDSRGNACLGIVINTNNDRCYFKTALGDTQAKSYADAWVKCTPASSSPPAPPFEPIYIDAGNPAGMLDPVTGIEWLGDDGSFTLNGTNHVIASSNLGPFGNLSKVDQTLKAWRSGDSCYAVPVSEEKGRYLVRLSFCYNNYDNNYISLNGVRQLPTIGVALEEYFVEAISNFGSNSSAYYTDYILTVSDGTADICLLPLQSSVDAGSLAPPFVNSLQVLPMDNLLYGPTRDDIVLSTWIRINAGGTEVVPTAADSQGYRTWDADYEPSESDNWKPLSSARSVSTLSQLERYATPQGVYQTARQAGGKSTGYQFKNIHPVNPDNKFLVVFYFAELNETVKVGDRVFNVWCNGKFITDIDLVAINGSNWGMIYELEVPLMNLAESEYSGWTGVINVLLYSEPNSASSLPPILNGLEVYEIIQPYVLTQEENAYKLRIDCGADQNYTDPYGNVWLADSFFGSGGEANVLAPQTGLRMATTVRYFDPTASSATNCYSVPVESGRYVIRAFFNYGNWDLDPSKKSPIFSIAAEGVVLVRIQPNSPGFFESVLAYVEDETVDFCLIADDGEERPTFISSLEVLQVDETAYAPAGYEAGDVMLYTYYRVAVGGETFGDGLSSDRDRGMRQWLQDNTTITFQCTPECLEPLETETNITGSDQAPNFWPTRLYQSARSADANGAISYELDNIIPGMDILIYFHFAELDDTVQAGERVFSVDINGTQVTLTNAASGANYTEIDIMQRAGGIYTALDVYTVYKVPATDVSEMMLQLSLKPNQGSKYGPILSGLEVLGAFPSAIPTDYSEAFAMQVMKDELQVGEYLGWTGDPCVPVPWTGVKCVEQEGSNRISVINLPGSGLRGFLSDEIGALSELVTLNLSSNGLTGGIPNDINSINSLVTIDLSNNNLNGSIPEDLASLPSLKTLYLQENNLEGQLPSDLNPPPSSVQVNYGGNPSLCGGAGLPDCSGAPPNNDNNGAGVPSLAPPTKTGGDGGGSNMGAIIGGLIGGIVVIAILGLIVIMLLRRRRTSAKKEEEKAAAASTSKRQNPYWRSKTGEFEMMNPIREV